MKEKSMTRNHGGGIVRRGNIEKETMRRHDGGEIVAEESWRSNPP